MHLHGGGVLVVIRKGGSHGLGGSARKGKIQRHQHLHAAVVVAHHRHEHRRVRKAADLLHLRQVLVAKTQAVALGRIQLAVRRAVGAFVVRDHLFAAAGVAGDAGAAEGVALRHQPQLHQRAGNADKAAGIAAGHRHTIGILDLFLLTLQLREAVVPGGIGAEGGGGVQHLHVRAQQGHDFFRSRIRQAEEGKVGRIDDLCPLVHILAPFGRDGQQLDLRAGCKTVGDAQAGGAGRAINKYLYLHAFSSSHASSRAAASAICFSTLAALGPP